jgi:glycosyltransferase involved in cell wall biosynthesis
MAPYAPRQLPLLFDMLDVDSEKWLWYAQSRRPGFLFRLEAQRLRRWETYWSMAAQGTVLTTQNEESLLRSFAPQALTCFMENGVDSEYFDGVARPLPSGLKGRRFVVFVGTMDYHPNIEAVQWFANRVLPGLRRQDTRIEFLIVGRNPAKAVWNLARLDGVTIAADVPDTRPYLAHARAIVAPLSMARGIQNKVLEALAMGRAVFASTAVCETFGKSVPAGVFCCASAAEFVDRVSKGSTAEPHCDTGIRAEACRRFSWRKNVEVIIDRLDAFTDSATALERS